MILETGIAPTDQLSSRVHVNWEQLLWIQLNSVVLELKGKPTLVWMIWMQYSGCSYHLSQVHSSTTSASRGIRPITETWNRKFFPQASANPQCPFSAMPASLLSLPKTLYRTTVIKAAAPINCSNGMCSHPHPHPKRLAHIYLRGRKCFAQGIAVEV